MLRRFFRVQAVGGVGSAAAVYVPLMLVNRAMALVRVVVVGRLLGAAGKEEFSRYQLGAELVNWVVPLIMLGLADTAERYVAHYERLGQARALLRRHIGRLMWMGGGTLLVFVAGRRGWGGCCFRMRGDRGCWDCRRGRMRRRWWWWRGW